MSGPRISRRRFNQILATSMLMSGLPGLSRAKTIEVSSSPVKLKVAAIQMVPELGNVQANMNQAEALIQQAITKGAEWIILPEMFTTAAGFHPELVKAIRPLDGPPAQLLKTMSRKNKVVIGGSFLAKRSGDVYNTFVLAFPDGSTLLHDKDYPTYWENTLYKGGGDDGVLNTPIGPVGSVLCWEFIRSQTARRLQNKVKLVVGGSCWWTLPDEADADSRLWADNLKILKDAPPQLARMLGVPVIHGSHAGRFEGFYSPDLPDVAYNSSYLGEAMIVDANGNVLARRGKDAGEGVVLAEIELPEKPVPSEKIPERFWTPELMPQHWKDSWQRWFASGSHYYKKVTIPYLETGKINEYTPEYL